MKIIGYIGSQVRAAINEQRGFVSAEEISGAVRQASNTVFGLYAGHVALYRPGQPLPPRAYGLSDRINTALAPFIREQVYSRTPEAGEIRLTDEGLVPFPLIEVIDETPTPVNFQHPTALRLPGARKVTAVNENAVAARLANSITAPTTLQPIRWNVPGGYAVLPVPDKLTLSFLVAPPECVYAEKPSEENELDMVYDDDESVDVGWRDVSAINEIIAHSTRLLGGTVKDPQAISLATQNALMGP